MSNPENNASKLGTVEATDTPKPSAPPASDVEKQTAVNGNAATATSVKRWKREEMVKKCSLVLRWSGFLFSFLAFVVMVSNRHGKSINFEDYEEYSYVLAIAIMSTVYTATQVIRQVVQLGSGGCMFHQPAMAIVDFVGDQILAYLLISAASTAATWTTKIRDVSINSKTDMFIDTAAAAVSMAFLAFFVLAASAIVSGYQLSTQF